MLVREAARLASLSSAVLQIKGIDCELDGVADGLVTVPWRVTYILQLSLGADGHFRIPDAKERAKIKWAVAKAAKLGVVVRRAETEQDVRNWYPVYLATMRRSVVVPRPLRFFMTIWESMRPAGLMDLLLAEVPDGAKRRVIAGSVFLYFKDTVSYSFSGLDRKFASTRANDAIMWHAINDACGRGFHKLDFGEVPDGHSALANFKAKWGAERHQLFRYYSPGTKAILADSHEGSGGGGAAAAVWRYLPLQLTEWIGDRVCSYL
jgi:CelD/BcsL family acetyltransferase involved in cellulose biosynthesis